ncbi:MAG TPA: DNA repair protein RecN, partial [Chloroflexota bacterium]|nr:DNA repair protein RecN [Chloroflexota bacterium]
LQELAIRNFALLEAVQIPFGAGLNVLTGETGAGKSIIIDALGAVLGGRITTEVIRTGSDRALVEAIFALPGGEGDPLRRLLEGLGLEGSLDGDSHDPAGNGQAGGQDEGGEPALILARELSRSGRSVARVNGRTVPVSTLAQIGALLVDIHGQHEHLSLLRPEAQRDLLDHFGALQPRRSELAALVREWRAVRAEWRSLQQDEREAARRIDLLSFQIEEIGNARLQPGEEETLQRERTLLVNAARLAELATAVHQALSGGEGDTQAALDLLGSAGRDLAQLVRIDPQMAPQEEVLTEAVAQVEEVSRALRAYSEAVELTPERLTVVEERLELLRGLQRKYGATIEEVLQFGERAAAELDGLVNREARAAALETKVAALETEIGAAAGALSQQRASAGERLAAAVAAELRALSLRGAFEVALLRRANAGGVEVDGERVAFDETGIDEVEFRFAPNVGEPSKPVARTASGGELSRILLALKSVLSAVDRTPTLIFDEVDSGVGGRGGQVLGEKLSRLAGEHQVLCVTHLPQIAAWGDRHFYIAKGERGGRTVTTVTPLEGEPRARELAQMLGGVTPATLEQARELRARAETQKHTPVRATPSNGKAIPATTAGKPPVPSAPTRRRRASRA